MSSHLAPPSTPNWRPIAWITAMVVLVHALLLGLLPNLSSAPDLPLEHKFITRTIVIAPPAAPQAPAPAPAAAKPEAPKPPRPVHRPNPAPPQQTQPVEPKPAEMSPEPAPVQAVQDDSAKQSRTDASIPADTSVSGPVGATNQPDSGPITDGSAGASGTGSPPIATTPVTKAVQVHASTRLSFELLGQRGAQPWQGVMGELIWLQNGSEYNAQLALKVFFKTIRSQTSIGRIDATGIAPNRFSETRRGEVASHFVREQGKVIFSTNAPTADLLPGAQDRLSVVMQLGAMLAGDASRYPDGSQIAIQTVGTKDAEVWTFNVEGTEQITVPSGQYTVRRLSRTPRNDYDYKLELWLAPELGYLPARMRQTQLNGDVIDLQLRGISDP